MVELRARSREPGRAAVGEDRVPRRRLLAGLFLAVTLHAFHAMAVVVIVPALAADLDGRAFYGAVFSAYLLASLLGLVAAGGRVDRLGPRRPLGEGLALFGAGLVGSAVAPTIGCLVAARAIEGLGGGALMAVLTATVNREYTAGERPRILAWMSAAWIVPGLVAPPIAGWITDVLGWRWVFLGVLPLVAVSAVLTLPALSSTVRARSSSGERPRVRHALALSAGVGLALLALGHPSQGLSIAMLVAGVVLGGRALGRIVPGGNRRPIVTTRLALTFVFFGADTFLPLALTDVRHTSAAVAGALMTVGAVCWSLGAFGHARLVAVLSPARAVALGVAAIGIGVVGEIAALDASTPLAIAFASWALAGLGMGLAYNATGVTAMGATPSGCEGETSSALGVADALGFALAAGIGGAVVALGQRNGWATAQALTVTWIIMVAASAGTGLLVTLGPFERAPARQC